MSNEQVLRTALEACPSCGKRAPPNSIHTCSPQDGRDEQIALSDERILDVAEDCGAMFETGWWRMTQGDLIDFARTILAAVKGMQS